MKQIFHICLQIFFVANLLNRSITD